MWTGGLLRLEGSTVGPFGPSSRQLATTVTRTSRPMIELIDRYRLTADPLSGWVAGGTGSPWWYNVEKRSQVLTGYRRCDCPENTPLVRIRREKIPHHAQGPITEPQNLGPALRRAVERVEKGEVALVDVVTQPR